MKKLKTGYVLQGDDQDNDLTATMQVVGHTKEYFNIVHGGGGDDTIDVDDLLSIEKVGTELYGDEGNDTIHGPSALYGKHVDTLSGGSGNDILYDEDAKDVFDGGAGTDTLHFQSASFNPAALKISSIEIVFGDRLNGDNADLSAFREVHVNQLQFSEQAQMDGGALFKGHTLLTGSGFSDYLDVSASKAFFKISAGAGDDTIISGPVGSTLFGEAGNDTITGSLGDDTIDGGEGNDVINGGGGNDTITDKSGHNTVHGGSGDDVLIGGNTGDIITEGKSGSTTGSLFDGGAGNDVFDGFAGSGEVTLVGGKGDDTLKFNGDASHLHVTDIETLEIRPHTQNDSEVTAPISASIEFLESFKRIMTFANQTEADIHLTDGGTFRWHDTQDKLSGRIVASGEGNVIDLNRATGFWSVIGGRNDDVIELGTGGGVYAAEGNDRIVGSNGSDEIRGAEGNDTIDGRGGDDQMQGDSGRDTFVFEAKSGRDMILDFDATSKRHDVIDLSAVHGIADYDDLMHHHVAKGGDGSVVISIDGKDSIVVSGVTEAQLDPSLFVF